MPVWEQKLVLTCLFPNRKIAENYVFFERYYQVKTIVKGAVLAFSGTTTIQITTGSNHWTLLNQLKKNTEKEKGNYLCHYISRRRNKKVVIQVF